jgi:hypothetical protein
MSKGNQNIINEFYSKCLSQKLDITTKVSEIYNGVHNMNVIDKVKEKILEKLENYEESLKMSEQILNDMDKEEKLIWKK